jgi:hypothetical protein
VVNLFWIEYEERVNHRDTEKKTGEKRGREVF